MTPDSTAIPGSETFELFCEAVLDQGDQQFDSPLADPTLRSEAVFPIEPCERVVFSASVHASTTPPALVSVGAARGPWGGWLLGVCLGCRGVVAVGDGGEGG